MVNTKFEILSGYSKDEIEYTKKWTAFFREDSLEKLKEYHHTLETVLVLEGTGLGLTVSYAVIKKTWRRNCP